MADPHGMPKPLFAPVSQGQQGDDFDINEIFADYFISEFNDPLNAYTSAMANYSGGVAAVTVTQASNAGAAPGAAVSLPTGGIRTAFHSGALPPASAVAAAAVAAAPSNEPSPKKPRQEGPTHPLLPGHPGAQLGDAGMAGQVPLQQVTAAMPQIQLTPNPLVGTQSIPLPVGVGIKLGGVGGVAPAMAQSAARGAAQGHFTNWGGADVGAKSDQSIAERRQRNREHAKRSRVRKKFMLESLHEQVLRLQHENKKLRQIVQEHITEHAQEIIAECCAKNPVFGDLEGADEEQEAKLSRSDFNLVESLTSGQQNFVLSDPRLPDNPIVFASPGFYKLTGYTSDQVLGRNCRFLQGRGTDPKAVDIIRKAVASGADATCCLLNYKADGTPFWNQLFIAALRDSDNCIVNYVGVQCEVEPEAGANALEDRVNEVLPLQQKDDEANGDGKNGD